MGQANGLRDDFDGPALRRLDGKAPSILSDAQRRALVEAVERGPIPTIHGAVRWRMIDLTHWLYKEFAVSLDATTVKRELKKTGLCEADRPPPSPCAERTRRGGIYNRGFASAVAEIRATLPQGTPIKIWFQDRARVGQKNTITHCWPPRGTRPSAPKAQRTKSAHIFGAICPEEGTLLHPRNSDTAPAEIALGVWVGAARLAHDR
ncbi:MULTISPECIES: hypothetical protein [Erythrobacteraceae]|uniref:Winged helix-turn helix domain-containing protein n=1 Tax=Erythrobacter westpacificensis TaxID=1055231 RepID=A0ABP9KFK6_9SPHN|nr:hypothetical protein [Aurantiacibacter zhengii]